MNLMPAINMEKAVAQCRAICNGRTVTGEYRQWCSLHGHMWHQGVFEADHPAPFPIKNPMACDDCGHVVSQEAIETGYRYHKSIMQATWGEPEESETICPACHAVDPFQPATTCSECGDYPCTCMPQH